tara:strand:- start:2849 stop:3676 length:828 start_codon:yes stop_codon:yes gene_type:complete
MWKKIKSQIPDGAKEWWNNLDPWSDRQKWSADLTKGLIVNVSAVVIGVLVTWKLTIGDKVNERLENESRLFLTQELVADRELDVVQEELWDLKSSYFTTCKRQIVKSVHELQSKSAPYFFGQGDESLRLELKSMAYIYSGIPVEIDLSINQLIASIPTVWKDEIERAASPLLCNHEIKEIDPDNPHIKDCDFNHNDSLDRMKQQSPAFQNVGVLRQYEFVLDNKVYAGPENMSLRSQIGKRLQKDLGEALEKVLMNLDEIQQAIRDGKSPNDLGD